MEQVAAAMSAVRRELDALGMQCAVVLRDPQLQDDDTDRLFYAGNVGTEAGGLMLEMYLEMAKSPKARVTTSEVKDTSFAPALPN